MKVNLLFCIKTMEGSELFFSVSQHGTVCDFQHQVNSSLIKKHVLFCTQARIIIALEEMVSLNIIKI